MRPLSKFPCCEALAMEGLSGNASRRRYEASVSAGR
eukprot:CAMPEP_0197680298 /NCGR_PEP_ID=MMETSP1338-20131121/93102_1 /TAXON_ID=43686 ORGANISM="Pelagodinium beii, Strain RCC1491" /NCGR_SAMPLE_ID=MMETSP1338 /ASSEMBLY_ACC=CAM_ASM_000754 /LENGTH=35 /DNA_ID= /DNA_START= /DNA_END= /DNA_ORIENTATION=